MRNIRIINNQTQEQFIFDSEAVTLGELKAEMKNKNIKFDGLAFYEGHARVNLVDDQSALPNHIPFRGDYTDDLVIMLTQPAKKIASGSMSRKECYEYIKSNNLGDQVKGMYGKNYTNCNTNELIAFISIHFPLPKKEKSNDEVEVENIKDAEVDDTVVAEVSEVGGSTLTANSAAIMVLAQSLRSTHVISQATYNKVAALLGVKADAQPEKLSEAEIKEMFDFLQY